MQPFRRVAWGFLVVFVDIRLGGFDVVPDVIGWTIGSPRWRWPS